jgi:hypothetical protein
MSAGQTIRDAIASRTPISARYDGRSRIFCPHAIGRKNGKLKVLMFQIGGKSKSGLSADATDNWRCVFLQELSAVALAPDETWQTPANWSASTQTCIDNVTGSI